MRVFAVYTERSKSTDLVKLFQKEEDAVRYVRLSDRVSYFLVSLIKLDHSAYLK